MNEYKGSILIADDDQRIRYLLKEILEDNEYKTYEAGDGYEALSALKNNSIDLVLLDLQMPGVDGLQVLKEAQKFESTPFFIVVTAHGTIRTAIEATRFGAYDFIEKPIEEDRILLLLEKALNTRLLEKENVQLKKALYTEYEIIGSSPAIQEVRDKIKIASTADASVLISGNNGTGKDLVARNIHLQSSRAGNKFININCAAIPEQLIESELFGYEKGAFTGAMKPQSGKFEYASGGTLLLNEIGEMSTAMQAKLLHVLENRTFQRLGSHKEIEVDVRIIAATNINLFNAMDDGTFRKDLYYRLQAFEIRMPDLKERTEDIILLFNHFMRQFCEQNGLISKELSAEAISLLLNYDWPGNVRQLKNLASNLAFTSKDMIISPQEIKQILTRHSTDKAPQTQPIDKSLNIARANFEREYITNKLDEHAWNVRRAASSLQVERTHLYKLMKKLGIER
ncbi:MAG: sigma-54 dependent transcriptional regulator [Calditrichales bacterium]|nr:sigma-54 dependent transcriptional regulator [Calditrichales bacterium]